MLLTLLLWIYATILTFLAGDALLQIGRRWVGPMPVLAAPLVCLLGAAGLTVILGWAWLVSPINLPLHLIIAGFLTGYAIWQRPLPIWAMPRWHLPWLGWTVIGVLGAVSWLRSVQLPRLADTGGYHAPMIEWIHQYAIVPGLANLNYRFGFNNSWFLFTTLFRFQLAPAIPWHGLNGWLMVMLGWFSLTEWHRWQTDGRIFSAWLGGWMAPGLLLIFHWTLSSPSPDLPAQSYVALCFWLWLRRAEPNQRPYADTWAWLLLLLSLSALTTKLSAVTVLLLPAFVTLQLPGWVKWRWLLLSSVTVLAGTGYWWVSNVILSGYVVYPSLNPLVNWFTVDWQVPGKIITVGLKNLQQGTRGDLGGLTDLGWVPYWFRTRPVLEQGIFVALLVAPLVIFRYRSLLFTKIPGYKPALLAAGAGVIFWFLLAPEIRFGAGNVLLALGLSYGPVFSQRVAWSGHMQGVVLGAVGLVSVLLLLAAVRREPVDWLLPAGYPHSPLRTYKTDNHPVLYPTDNLRVINGIRGYWGNCYDVALPCSPYPMPGLRWRGQTLGDGFRTVESIGH